LKYGSASCKPPRWWAHPKFRSAMYMFHVKQSRKHVWTQNAQNTPQNKFPKTSVQTKSENKSDKNTCSKKQKKTHLTTKVHKTSQTQFRKHKYVKQVIKQVWKSKVRKQVRKVWNNMHKQCHNNSLTTFSYTTILILFSYYQVLILISILKNSYISRLTW
jgi:hypothetical protein